MTATDPACTLAPQHDLVLRARADSQVPTEAGPLIRLRRPPELG